MRSAPQITSARLRAATGGTTRAWRGEQQDARHRPGRAAGRAADRADLPSRSPEAALPGAAADPAASR
jgi:hypothetical protein